MTPSFVYEIKLIVSKIFTKYLKIIRIAFSWSLFIWWVFEVRRKRENLAFHPTVNIMGLKNSMGTLKLFIALWYMIVLCLQYSN